MRRLAFTACIVLTGLILLPSRSLVMRADIVLAIVAIALVLAAGAFVTRLLHRRIGMRRVFAAFSGGIFATGLAIAIYSGLAFLMPGPMGLYLLWVLVLSTKVLGAFTVLSTLLNFVLA